MQLTFCLTLDKNLEKFYHIPLPKKLFHNFSEISYSFKESDFVIIESSALPEPPRENDYYCVPKWLRNENNFNYPGCLKIYLEKSRIDD